MRSLVVGLAALTLAVVPLVVSAPPAAAVTGEQYVALGDSYAAGLGVAAIDTSTNAQPCSRSASNYPHRLATALGLVLTDVTCSGAVVADLADAQETSGTTVPPQIDALGSGTRLVTLTVGGNDLGFSKIAQYCASLSGPDGPVSGGGGQAADCESHYVTGGDDTLAADLTDTVRPALTAALATIKQRAPQAAVLLVDYPAIVPDAANTPGAGCWTSPLESQDSLPFTTADLPYLQQTQARLDQLLADVAGTAGASVTSVYADSLAHTACGSQPWVNGVRVTGFSVAPSSLHPNAAGIAAITAAAIPAARSLLAGGTVAAPPTISTTDAGSGSGVPGWVWGVVAVVVLLVVIVGFGAFRVVRRRR